MVETETEKSKEAAAAMTEGGVEDLGDAMTGKQGQGQPQGDVPGGNPGAAPGANSGPFTGFFGAMPDMSTMNIAQQQMAMQQQMMAFLQNGLMMQQKQGEFTRPPDFIKDKTEFEQYKLDISMTRATAPIGTKWR